jgi:hypothetical protein
MIETCWLHNDNRDNSNDAHWFNPDPIEDHCDIEDVLFFYPTEGM